MGIFERFKDIVSSGLTDLLDNDEPEEKVREHIVRLSLNLADVRKEVGETNALLAKITKRLEECDADIERFGSLSEKAAAAGNQQDTRVFLSKQYDLKKRREELQQRYDEVSATSRKLKDTHNSLVREINELNMRLSQLNSREAAADAQQYMNRAAMERYSVDSQFDEIESRIEADNAAADAEAYSYTDSQ